MPIELLRFVSWDANDQSWKTRMNHIKSTISNNPLAPYVIRSVDVGSEPLLDQVCWHRWLLFHVAWLTLFLQPVDPNTLLNLVK